MNLKMIKPSENIYIQYDSISVKFKKMQMSLQQQQISGFREGGGDKRQEGGFTKRQGETLGIGGYLIIHFEYVQFIVCPLYFNKAVFLKFLISNK